MERMCEMIEFVDHTDAKTAEAQVFDGFHSRIAWNSPQAKAGCITSLKYR
jgi:hypothetical protein